MGAIRLLVTATLGVVIAALGTVFAQHTVNGSYLDQGFKDHRTAFYHAPQVQKILPYAWFLALQRHDSSRADDLFHKTLVNRYGFVPDDSHPDKLPVGFIKTKKLPMSDGTKGEYLGFNCAACHTGQINYRHNGGPVRTYYIDGGPTMHNNLAFAQDMVAALGATVRDTERFVRFAARLGAPAKAMPALRRRMNEELEEMLMMSRIAAERGVVLFPVAWGWGRLDSFSRGGNVITMKVSPENVVGSIAPASIPPLWDALEYDRVQWNGSIQNPMARSVVQSLAQRAPFAVEPDLVPTAVDVDLRELKQLEDLAYRIQPPPWPADFPAPDVKKAKNGKKLFGELCQTCHLPEAMTENAFKQRWKTSGRLYPLDVIGTDPAHAMNFYGMRIKVPTKPALAEDTQTAPRILATLTSRIMKAAKWPQDSPNDWYAELKYLARPLTGIWATPPYLHNGSVPNIYELLSPQSERSKTFCVASLLYDFKRLGYETHPCQYEVDAYRKELPFDTTIPGNFNSGHEFRSPRAAEKGNGSYGNAGATGIIGPALSEDQRYEIIEYLKTCDLMLPERGDADQMPWKQEAWWKQDPRMCSAKPAVVKAQ